MVYVFLSIVCSVIVAVLLKLAKRYEINASQAIAWNYAAAALASFLLFDIKYTFPADTPVYSYAALAILLPSVFIAIAVSVRQSGIIRTAVAQRLSLIIPVLAAFIIFGEELSPWKITGLLIGFSAIICSVPWQKQKSPVKSSGWIYPFIVFAGTGVIDIFFNRIAQYQKVPFTTSLTVIFVFAALVSLLTLFCLVLLKRIRFSVKNLIAGLILGVFNFGSIVFYLQALRLNPTRPSVIFSALDIGVITFGALTGFWLFRERISLINKAGIILAIIAVLIISFA